MVLFYLNACAVNHMQINMMQPHTVSAQSHSTSWQCTNPHGNNNHATMAPVIPIISWLSVHIPFAKHIIRLPSCMVKAVLGNCSHCNENGVAVMNNQIPLYCHWIDKITVIALANLPSISLNEVHLYLSTRL